MIHYESFIYDFPLSVAPLELGCSSDSECPGSRACENRECVDPCLVRNPCTGIATCRPQNHRAQCFCPEGTTGDGYRSCTPSNLKKTRKEAEYAKEVLFVHCSQKRGMPQGCWLPHQQGLHWSFLRWPMQNKSLRTSGHLHCCQPHSSVHMSCWMGWKCSWRMLPM